MAVLTEAAAAMRAAVEKAVTDEIARAGRDNFSRAGIVKPFLAKGGKRATLFRWVDEILASGRPDEHASRLIVAAAEERVARAAEREAASPPAAIESALAAKLPTVPKVEHIASAGAIPVIERLNVCLEAADQLMKHARTDDGKVRNSKLLLASSEHLRRCLETTARIYDTVMRADKIERYHAAIIEEIAAESPELAERVLVRISRLTTAWGNGA